MQTQRLSLGQEGNSVDALTSAISAIRKMGGEWEVGELPQPVTSDTKRITDVSSVQKMTMFIFPQIGTHVQNQYVKQELEEGVRLQRCCTVPEALLWLTDPINFARYFSQDQDRKMIICAGSVYQDGTIPCVLIGTGYKQPYSIKFLVTDASTVNRFGFGLQL
jgi:hypothetical protein